LSPTYHEPEPHVFRDPNDPNLNLDPNADPNLPYDPRAAVEPRVEPLAVDPPTAQQLTALLVAIRRIAPGSARRVVEIIDTFALHYYPDGLPEIPPTVEPPPIETSTFNLLASDLMALMSGFAVVYPTAGGTVEFLGCELAYTFGTLPFDALAGTFSVRSQGGTTISDGCAGTGFIDQLVSGTGSIAPLAGPWNIGAVDAPLELAYLPSNMTGGDGTVEVVTSYRKWPAGTAPSAAAAGLSIPPFKFGVA